MSQTSYVSILGGISEVTDTKVTSDNGTKDKSDAGDEEGGVDEKELEATVEDLMCIKKKDVLKRNLTVMVRENLALKKKVKILESRTESHQQQLQHLSFHVDTEPNDDDMNEVDEILYTEGRIDVLTGVLEEEPQEEKKSRPKNTCFNCLGDHMIADCPEPKDQRKIAKNRKEFMGNQGSRARYHEDEPQKFAKLEPGLPSDKLREALGLKSGQLPEYIYRMRNLGYPPGWKKYAEITSSGMILYKAFGEKAGKNKNGEVGEEASCAQYDIEKLKDWPGFNSYPSPILFDDESRYYRVPSINERDLLEEMKKKLKPREQKGYKKRKMQDVSTSKDDHKEQAMDVDTDSQDDPVPPPPGEEEPEIVDLEHEDSKDVEDGEVVSDSEITGDVPSDVKSTPLRQDSTASQSSVSKTEPGTPIVEIYSPFGSLPKMDSFAEGATDHILFENLPDYTGKWEQMSGLIKTIRKRKSQMEKDQDKDY